MEFIGSLDIANLTLIIENMAYRNEAMIDGGTNIYCRYPKLEARMSNVIEHLITEHSLDLDVDDRYKRLYTGIKVIIFMWRHID